MIKKNPILCVVCSAGGHFAEATLATKGIDYAMYYVTYREPHIDMSLKGTEFYYILNPHKYWWKYPVNFAQSLIIFLKKRPKFILSTGSGMALSTCLIGKFFGSKIIFIETGARIHTPSLTGRFMYHFSDLFIVQWESLQKQYPKALFGGLLF